MITSLNNPKIKEYAKLLDKKYRYKNKLFIVEGNNMVEEALKQNIVLEVLTTDKNKKGTLVAPFILNKLISTPSSQGIVAICKMIKEKEIKQRVLALDNVQDPGNVGTLIRTAKAFGFTDVIISGADLYSPKTLRSSQGAIFGINIIQTKDITSYFENKQVIGALLNKEAKVYSELKPLNDFILVLGNEGNGISKEVEKNLTDKVYIPIEFESLNVAVAGAILLNAYKKSF